MDALDALMSAMSLPASYRRMVEAVHRPVASAIARRQADLRRPMVVGLCGSQGSGKSTMAAFLKALLQDQGLRAAILSLDDLYLPRGQREHLARTAHPLLLTRGAPGTHDPGLGMALIDILTDRSGAEVSLPRFDKAEDDRAAAQTWPRVRAPIDVVLLEGWCVGAAPQPDTVLGEPINPLERDQDADGRWRRYVNAQLKGDYARLFSRIDVLALLQAPSFDVVFGWRALQEKRLAERVAREGISGRRVMSDEEIGAFLMHYQRLTEWILEEMPGRADIVMPLDPNHRITGVRFRSVL
jgi:D-glycerate 3-kinase